jgi:CheY-like chemotaxis protein
VQIRLERAEPNVELTISDNGQGIKPDFLPFAFDRFSQTDGSIVRAHGGLGVGLAIVKSIVELHGGTVRAQSEGEGLGASFTVLLPINERWVNDQPQGEQPAREVLSSVTLDCPSELAGLRILVTDDEPDTCEMVKTAFEQCGSIVRMATSAAGALAQMDTWLPDLLIADISMPAMDGYELIRQVRKRHSGAGGKIPAVALTAMARIEDRVKALACGYQMHVAKPVELGELRAVVASLASIVVERK